MQQGYKSFRLERVDSRVLNGTVTHAGALSFARRTGVGRKYFLRVRNSKIDLLTFALGRGGYSHDGGCSTVPLLSRAPDRPLPGVHSLCKNCDTF